MQIDDILKNTRQTSGDYHAAAGAAWRKYGVNELLNSPLVYSAFEFRLAIERYVFEIYYLILNDNLVTDDHLSDDDLKKIESFSSLVKIIHENAGNKSNFYKALKFNRVFAKVFTQLPKRLSIPDIGRLHKFWQKTSDYCHRQLQPEITWDSVEWIKKGYKLLSDVESYLWKISVEEEYGWVSKSSLITDLQEEREKFINDQHMTEEQLELRLTLMKPGLDLRAGIPINLIFQR